MRCFIGIDLGSTTTKAVVMDENRNVLGRGITNSRSNYDTAAAIAKQEALVNGRFFLFRQALGEHRRARTARSTASSASSSAISARSSTWSSWATWKRRASAASRPPNSATRRARSAKR